MCPVLLCSEYTFSLNKYVLFYPLSPFLKQTIEGTYPLIRDVLFEGFCNL